MYLSANLAIDPSQLTKIENIVPSKTFKKVLYIMTGGASSKKIEKETFNALSILQQFHSLFHAMNITNMVRLSQDEIDLYVDRKGKDNDLDEALEKYDMDDAREAMSEQFNVLQMILEHQRGSLQYYIKIKISRSHAVGEYPILVEINALLSSYKDLEKDEVDEHLEKIFSSQKSFDSFLLSKHDEFNGFLEEISANVQKFIYIDDIVVNQRRKVIVAKRNIQSPQDIRIQNYASDPVFHSYYGTNDYLFYAFRWIRILRKKHLKMKDVLLYSIEGEPITYIDEEGVYSDEHPLLKEDIDYEAEMDKAAKEYREYLKSKKKESHEIGVHTSNWFDFGEEKDNDDWY